MTPQWYSDLKRKINKYTLVNRTDEGRITNEAQFLVNSLYSYLLSERVEKISELPTMYDPITKI